MSRAVVHGDTVYLAGHVSDDRSLGVGGQTAAILARIEQVLTKAGSDKSKILSVSIWLSDISRFEEMNAIYDAWVDRSHLPARATVEAKLASPNYLVEIAMIAAL